MDYFFFNYFNNFVARCNTAITMIKLLITLNQLIVDTLKAADYCAFRLGCLRFINTFGRILNTMRAIKGSACPYLALFLLCVSYFLRVTSPMFTIALRQGYDPSIKQLQREQFILLLAVFLRD